ncbi:MAG: 7-carboxy-7-deazaguanine synthase QueE, partial [Waddliaceae bacterium]
NLYQNLDTLKPQDEVKFVILNQQDYAFAKQVCEKYNLFVRPTPPLFSPVFDQLEAKNLVSWILNDRLSVRLNLQTHKFIWHPTTRGV